MSRESTQPGGCLNLSNTDRIEGTIVLRAPRSRVWRALTEARALGTWFRALLEGPFAEGTSVRGRITIPEDNHQIELQIIRIDPERLFSYRWHPYSGDPAADYPKEPTTLT